MRAVFLSVLMVCALAEAGIYYLADEAGNVTRHEGDTPYPAGAVWNSKCPRTADEETLSVVEGVVAVDPVKVNAAAALRGPAPEVFVPMLNSDGEPVGTARLVVIEGSLSVLASTNSASPQKPWAEQRDQILAQLGGIAESKATAAAARLAIKQTVLAGELPEEDLGQIVDLWPAWAAGVSYALDEILRHEGTLYKVVQAHTSQADWAPSKVVQAHTSQADWAPSKVVQAHTSQADWAPSDVPSLFAEITPPGLIAEWVQPTGAQDTYSLGDLVAHGGKTWESTVDKNVWEPGVYGWVEVE